MRAIVLAAGQGSRMRPLTDHTPKPLLPFQDTTVLERLISQLLEHTEEITVVVGFEASRVKDTIRNNFGDQVKIVCNERYKEDVNILSLSVGLDGNTSPFAVFEADCLYEKECINRVFSPDLAECSSWFTIGDFLPPQLGGVLKVDKNMSVQDVRVIPEYDEQFSGYKKLIGILKVGPSEVETYIKCLAKSVREDTKQYYLQPWIDNLSALPSKAIDLSDCKVGAFNSPEEYRHVLGLFEELES